MQMVGRNLQHSSGLLWLLLGFPSYLQNSLGCGEHSSSTASPGGVILALHLQGRLGSCPKKGCVHAPCARQPPFCGLELREGACMGSACGAGARDTVFVTGRLSVIRMNKFLSSKR